MSTDCLKRNESVVIHHDQQHKDYIFNSLCELIELKKEDCDCPKCNLLGNENVILELALREHNTLAIDFINSHLFCRMSSVHQIITIKKITDKMVDSLKRISVDLPENIDRKSVNNIMKNAFDDITDILFDHWDSIHLQLYINWIEKDKTKS